LLSSGQIEEAVKQFESTFESNFHVVDDSFVSYYVRSGQLNMAYLLAAMDPGREHVPVKDFIEAIENPLEDHSARVARFNEWGKTYNVDVCDMDTVAVVLRQDQCLSDIENAGTIWHPDAAYFRKTPAFKEYVNTYLREYWELNGPPPQCMLMDDGDYECD